MYLKPLLLRRGRLLTYFPPLRVQDPHYVAIASQEPEDNSQSSDPPEAQDSHHEDIPPQELGGSQLALETSVTSINDLEKEMGKIDSKMVAIEHKAEDAITSMGNRIGFLLSYTGAWVFYQDLKLPCKVIWWIAFVSVVYMIGGLCLAIYGAARELKKMTTSVEKLDQERGKQVEKAEEIINSETSRSDQENQNANVDDISQLHPTEKSNSVMKRSELIKNSEKYLTRFKAYYWLYVCAAILCVVLNVACICCISYFTYCHAGISVGDSVPEASLANINSSELPPHLVLDMPALSPTMIEVGDILHEIETDKATTDVESLEKGLLAEILSPEGSKDVTVGQPIAITVEDENDVEAVRILSSSNNVVKEEKPVIAARTLESKQATPPLYLSTEKYDVKVSVNDIVIKVVATASRNVPEANAYWDNGKGEVVLCNSVDISAAVATEKGLMTPIIRNPDQKSISSISAEVIAARLLESKQSPPPLYLSTEKCDVKVSVYDIVIKVVAKASRNVPEANAYCDGRKGGVVLCDSVDISAAVATEKVEDGNDVEAVRTSSGGNNVVNEENSVGPCCTLLAAPSPSQVDQICKVREFERRRSTLPRKFLSLI